MVSKDLAAQIPWDHSVYSVCVQARAEIRYNELEGIISSIGNLRPPLLQTFKQFRRIVPVGRASPTWYKFPAEEFRDFCLA